MDFNFHMPTQIIFGCGKIKNITEFIGGSITNILIVTDKNVFEKCGAKAIIQEQLSDYNLFIFDNVEENPSYETINRGIKIAREKQIQLIIGLGGGSPIDAAKAIAAFAANNLKAEDYFNGKKIDIDPLPIIAIPTTSGTGSEVTPFSVLSDLRNDKKMCLAHPKTFPAFSIIDPELTYSMPESVIINTGLDLICHAIEAYLSTETFDLNNQYAIQALEIGLENIQKAAKKDKKAMVNMAYASMLAGVAITHSSTILLHIMAYPLTVFHHIAHGQANAILLPAFIGFMKQNSTVPEKIQKIENLFSDYGGVYNFIHSMGINNKLSSYGINANELDRFAQDTIIKDDVKITPALILKENILKIYESTF